jgi:predicted TPR repeat methyltransferase
MSDQQTIEVYNQKTQDYVNLIDRKPGSSLIEFVKKIPHSGRVLDLGCGPGTASAFMKSKGLFSDAVDASSEMVEFANFTYDLGAKMSRFSDITGDAIYDGVWANFSLLHVSKLEFIIHLKAIYKILKVNGSFSIGMKLGEGEHRDSLGRYYAYYSKSELLDNLSSIGFVFEAEYNGEEKGLAGRVEPWIILRFYK